MTTKNLLNDLPAEKYGPAGFRHHGYGNGKSAPARMGDIAVLVRECNADDGWPTGVCELWSCDNLTGLSALNAHIAERAESMGLGYTTQITDSRSIMKRWWETVLPASARPGKRGAAAFRKVNKADWSARLACQSF